MDYYLENLKNKFNYSEEIINFIDSLIPSFLSVLGEENKDIILDTLNNTYIFEFETIEEANKVVESINNDGNKHRVGPQATGSAFIEDCYINKENFVKQRLVIGVSKSNKNKVQSIIHELCHAMSSIGKYQVKNGVLHTSSGFNMTSYSFDTGVKGNQLSDLGMIFNEIITENIAMQVMDDYEKDVEHEPSAYNGLTRDFKGIFRNEKINKVFIDDYLKSTYNFNAKLSEIISQEHYIEKVDSIYQYVTGNTNLIEYLDYLKTLSVSNFFNLFIEHINYFTKVPEGLDRTTFKLMKQINSQILYDLSQALNIGNKTL